MLVIAGCSGNSNGVVVFIEDDNLKISIEADRELIIEDITKTIDSFNRIYIDCYYRLEVGGEVFEQKKSLIVNYNRWDDRYIVFDRDGSSVVYNSLAEMHDILLPFSGTIIQEETVLQRGDSGKLDYLYSYYSVEIPPPFKYIKIGRQPGLYRITGNKIDVIID